MQAYIGQIVPYYIQGNVQNVSLHIYFSGCNFRCKYCNVPDFLTFDEKHLVDLKEIKKEIRLNHAFIKSVFFTGGEPCLQKQALVQLAQFSKMLGLRVALDTNGSKPEILRELLELKLIDAVYLDMKTPLRADIFEKVTKSNTFFVSSEQLLADIRKTLVVLEKFKDKCEIVVITPVVPHLMFRKEDLFVIADALCPLASRWVLRRFHNNGTIVDKGLQNIQEPSFDFMESLKSLLQKHYPQLVIEVD